MRAREKLGRPRYMSRMFGHSAPDPRAQQQQQAAATGAAPPPPPPPQGPGPAGYPPSHPGRAQAGAGPQQQQQQEERPGFLESIGKTASSIGRDFAELGQEMGAKLGLKDPPQ